MESVIVQNGEASGLESMKQKPAEVFTNGKQQNGNNGFNDDFDIICLDEVEQDMRAQEVADKQQNKSEQKSDPEVIEVDDFELSFDVEETKESPKRSKRIKDKEVKNKEAKKDKHKEQETPVKETKKETPKKENEEQKQMDKEKVSELVDRIHSSGRRLTGRRPLRGLITPPHPASKRKAEDSQDSEERESKRCKTPSTESPGWRYYASPSSLFLKFKESLTPSRGKAVSSDDSMAVNFDDTIAQSPLDDSQFEADLQEKPKTWKTCNIM